MGEAPKSGDDSTRYEAIDAKCPHAVQATAARGRARNRTRPIMSSSATVQPRASWSTTTTAKDTVWHLDRAECTAVRRTGASGSSPEPACSRQRIDLRYFFPQQWMPTQPRNLLPVRQFEGSIVSERTATFAGPEQMPLAADVGVERAADRTASGTIRTESGSGRLNAVVYLGISPG